MSNKSRMSSSRSRKEPRLTSSKQAKRTKKRVTRNIEQAYTNISRPVDSRPLPGQIMERPQGVQLDPSKSNDFDSSMPGERKRYRNMSLTNEFEPKVKITEASKTQGVQSNLDHYSSKSNKKWVMHPAHTESSLYIKPVSKNSNNIRIHDQNTKRQSNKSITMLEKQGNLLAGNVKKFKQLAKTKD